MVCEEMKKIRLRRKSAWGVATLSLHASDVFLIKRKTNHLNFSACCSLSRIYCTFSPQTGGVGGGKIWFCGAHQKSSRFIHTKIVCGKLGLVTKNNLRVNPGAALPSIWGLCGWTLNETISAAHQKLIKKVFLPRAPLISKTIKLWCVVFYSSVKSFLAIHGRVHSLSTLMTWIYNINARKDA